MPIIHAKASPYLVGSTAALLLADQPGFGANTTAAPVSYFDSLDCFDSILKFYLKDRETRSTCWATPACQELGVNPGLSQTYLSHHLLPSRGCISRKLESGAEAGHKPGTPLGDTHILSNILTTTPNACSRGIPQTIQNLVLYYLGILDAKTLSTGKDFLVTV